MDLSKWKDYFQRVKIERDVLREQQADNRREIAALEHSKALCLQAHEIVQKVAKATQNSLQVRLSELCTIAMKSVFDNAYQLDVEFVERRSKTECDIMFIRNGLKIDPLSASGGGAVDIAALTLRLSLWGLMSKRSAPIFLLDEPLKWLKGGELPKRGAQLISYLSKELGIQVIMVSHSDELIEAADNVYRVTNHSGISEVHKENS